jgi:hypothetical protein
MGRGCQRVSCTHEASVDVVTGQWSDGRVATVRGIRAGKSDYGFVAFTDKGVTAAKADSRYAYRDLLRDIVKMFQTGKPPIEPAVTLEIVAFIEAAYKSSLNHGIGEKLAI